MIYYLDRQVFRSNDRICQSCTDRYATAGDGQVAKDGCNEKLYTNYTDGITPDTLDMTNITDDYYNVQIGEFR